jgi:hypothetical protein
LRTQTVPPFVHKQHVWLHLLLVAGIFVYLYSPLLDHWLGAVQTRPHTHYYITGNSVVEIFHLHDDAVTENDDDVVGYEQGVLCLLDLATQLAILLHLDGFLVEQIVHSPSLVFAAVPAYLWFSPVYLSSLDPPPRI